MDQQELLRRLQVGHLANVRFSDFVRLLEDFGFELERVTGSHHIYRHSRTGVRLNIQPIQRDAKPYQLRQFLQLVERHGVQFRTVE